MHRLSISVSIVFLSLSGPASAQSANFHGPIRGFVYSRISKTVRPLFGVPGATYIGASLLTGADFASIAPSGKWAVITQDGQTSCLRGLSDLAPTATAPDGLINAADSVRWTPDGTIALLYSSAANQLQRVRFSDTAATADAPVDLSSWGQVSALAIDSAGQQVAFGVAGSGLYLFRTGQSPALLSSMAKPVAAAFDGTGRRLYAVDLDQSQIMEFDSGSNGVVFASLVQADGSVITPMGTAISGDDRYLVLADSAAQAVRVYEMSSGNLTNTIPLDFSPSRFEALSAGTFLLNGDNGSEWLLVLDARQAPNVSFVPASPESAQ